MFTPEYFMKQALQEAEIAKKRRSSYWFASLFSKIELLREVIILQNN